LKLNRMLASMCPFILKEIIGAPGLDGIHQFPVHIQGAQWRQKIFSSQTEGGFYGCVGGPKDNEITGRILLYHLPVSKGITKTSPLKMDVGGHHSFQSICTLLLPERPWTISPFKVLL